jgi:hypothetical protein
MCSILRGENGECFGLWYTEGAFRSTVAGFLPIEISLRIPNYLFLRLSIAKNIIIGMRSLCLDVRKRPAGIGAD